MRCLQARERAPVHPLGFATGQVQNASVPAQPLADFVGLVGGPVVCQFALGAVGQLDPFEFAESLGFDMDDAEASGYDAVQDPIKLEVNALLAKAQELGVDTETIKLDASYATSNESEQAYYEAVRDALQAAIEGSNRDSSANAGAQGNERAQEGVRVPTEAEALAALESYTEADVRATMERAAQAEKDKLKTDQDAESKAKAERIAKEIQARQDASAENFSLGQSAEDSLAGQGSIFEPSAAYDVDAPRKKYQNDKQGDLFNDQLDLFLNSQPDASQAGPSVEVSRRDAVAAVQDLHATRSILAKALSSDYAARQRTNLVGQTVGSTEDLAVLAQLYRDPRFETFRVIFTGMGGKVVSQIGLTSRLPGSTSAIVGNDIGNYLKDLSRTAIQGGASDYYRSQHSKCVAKEGWWRAYSKC